MTTLRRGDQIFGTGLALEVSDTIIGTADEAEFAVPEEDDSDLSVTGQAIGLLLSVTNP